MAGQGMTLALLVCAALMSPAEAQETAPLAGGDDATANAGAAAPAAASPPQEAMAPPAEPAAPASSAQLHEVLVTARRRQERLADVPLAATVIDAKALEDRGGVTSAKDLLDGIPGVRFDNTTSPVSSEVSIRGSATARATNGDPSVGLYRDAAYIGGGFVGGRSFTRLDLFDVGRVEVLRGTQGALYGRNAVGGAVDIISARPEFEQSGSADLQYTPNVRATQFQAVENVPLDQHFATRFGVDFIHQNDGFYYNPDNNVHFDQQKGYGVRGQLRWRQSGWDVNLLAEAQRLTVPAVAYRVYIKPAPPVFPNGFIESKYTYPWSTEPLATQNVNNLMLTAGYGFDWARLTSTTMVRQRKSFYQFDADGVDAAILAAAVARGDVPKGAIDPNAGTGYHDNTFSVVQDTHLAGSALQDRLTWLTGGEFLFQQSMPNIINYRSPTPKNPSPGSSAPGRQDYWSGAAYGSLGYDLTRQLNLTGELRYTHDNKAAQFNLYDLATGAQTGAAQKNFTIPDSDSDNVSYNVTLSYKFLREFLAYAKVGTSYRAGGFNSDLGPTGQPITIPSNYNNETSTAYELGLKGMLSPSNYVAFAVYRTHVHDLIVQLNNGCGATFPACPSVAVNFLDNAGTADGFGYELEGVGRYDLGGGKLRASVGGSHQISEVASSNYQGFSVPQVPSWIATAELNYRHPFVRGSTLFGNVHYAAQWGGVQELVKGTAPLDDFQLVNLRAGVEIQAFELAGFVNNLGNSVYIAYQDATTQRYSEKRTYGFQLRYHW